MRYVLAIVAVMVTFLSLGQERPKGPVRSVYVTREDRVMGPIFVSKISYDRRGNMTHAMYADQFGKDRLEDSYDYHGSKLVETRFWDHEHDLGYRQVFVYRNGRVAEEKWYTQGGKNDHKSNYIYEGGRLVRTEQFRGKKEYPSLITFYDERGNEVEKMFVTEWEGGMRVDYWRNVYDRKKRLIEETEDGTDGKSRRTTYRYDDVNNSMRQTEYKNGRPQATKQYFYDRRGNIVKEVSKGDTRGIAGSISYKYAYDADGVLLKKTELYTGARVTTSYQDFDKYGNYRKVVGISESERGKDVTTTNRVIKYYEE